MLHSGVAAKGTWEWTRLQTVVSIASSAARRNDYSGTTLRAPHLFDTTMHLAIQSAGSPTHCNAQTCRNACEEGISSEEQFQALASAAFFCTRLRTCPGLRCLHGLESEVSPLDELSSIEHNLSPSSMPRQGSSSFSVIDADAVSIAVARRRRFTSRATSRRCFSFESIARKRRLSSSTTSSCCVG